MKILIIEDERQLAESVKKLLEAKGFKVEVVFDGEEGAAYAQMGIVSREIMCISSTHLTWMRVCEKP